jgi:hypothetical protein
VTVFSCDGFRWFSDKREAEQYEKARLKFLQQSARALRRMSTFKTPIGRRRRTKQRDGIS